MLVRFLFYNTWLVGTFQLKLKLIKTMIQKVVLNNSWHPELPFIEFYKLKLIDNYPIQGGGGYSRCSLARGVKSEFIWKLVGNLIWNPPGF